MKLNSQDEARLRTFYLNSLQKYGAQDARSMQWSTFENQQRRFQVIGNIIASSARAGHDMPPSVLDVGCGVGGLYRYFLKQNITVKYTGIDIMPEFISIAKEHFVAKRQSEPLFYYGNILDFSNSYDYVVASGALSFKIENNDEYYKEIIKKMYQLSTTASVFNMLDKRNHVDDDTYAAYYPDEIADFCQSFCPQVEIITDYLPQDFTVVLRR